MIYIYIHTHISWLYLLSILFVICFSIDFPLYIAFFSLPLTLRLYFNCSVCAFARNRRTLLSERCCVQITGVAPQMKEREREWKMWQHVVSCSFAILQAACVIVRLWALRFWHFPRKILAGKVRGRVVVKVNWQFPKASGQGAPKMFAQKDVLCDWRNCWGVSVSLHRMQLMYE